MVLKQITYAKGIFMKTSLNESFNQSASWRNGCEVSEYKS